MKKPFIITVHLQKGGVGKTTLTSLIGADLAHRGYRVLMIDTDVQKNLTVNHRMKFAEHDEEKVGRNSFNFLTKSLEKDYRASEYIFETEFPNIWMVPAEMSQGQISEELERKTNQFRRMEYYKTAFDKLEQEMSGFFDFILIDNGLALDLASYNAYQASDYVFMPAFPVPNAKEVIVPTYMFFEENAQFNTKLDAGLVFTNVTINKSVEKNTMAAVRKALSEYLKIYDTYIRIDTNIEKSQEIRVPTNLMSSKTKAVVDTAIIVDEFLTMKGIPLLNRKESEVAVNAEN